MNQRILYKTNEGGVAVIVPAPEYLETHTIEELAEKDVPPNTPYEIVDVSEIPEDRTWRDAWSWE
jgi:hypothetical protein